MPVLQDKHEFHHYLVIHLLLNWNFNLETYIKCLKLGGQDSHTATGS